MTTEESERLKEIEEKLDRALHTIEALGRILIRRRTAIERGGMYGNTLDRNNDVKKFEEIGHKRTFIEIGDLAVIKQRKRPAKKAGP